MDKIRARLEFAIAERIRLEGEMAAENERLHQARAGQVRLDERTSRLMAVLQGEGMSPRALCQVAEITQPDWREAAEALLGRDREAILVDPHHASRAVEILRADRDAYRGAAWSTPAVWTSRGRHPRPILWPACLPPPTIWRWLYPVPHGTGAAG
jgi:hypothetical protein